MLSTYLNLAFIVSAVRNGLVPLDSCTPVCPSPVSTSKLTPDPTDCSRYYYCLSDEKPSDFTDKCPDGELFDKDTCECKAAADATCMSCEPACKFECPMDGNMAVVAIPDDCQSFVVCNSGGSVPVSCDPDKPYFNGTSCTADESQCCDKCQVYCESPFTEIPDPTNCTNFYYCSQVGFPTEVDLHQCPDHRVFDQETRHCNREAACVQPCSSGPDGPTTTVGTDCVDTFVCEHVGYFPKCTSSCDPHYYYCGSNDIGHTADARRCPTGQVLNPEIMRCVNPNDCPYLAHV
ncbi:balbiani ring protein 3-like [Penaeus japonicus]|uniref:balbiani ring protein 3-like n=1 Tax=Penaeus japonicus TaxID=27405 RepID=UPI001C715A21|nr:balbiani ring protein 3-like [Penaeus japonicus]